MKEIQVAMQTLNDMEVMAFVVALPHTVPAAVVGELLVAAWIYVAECKIRSHRLATV